MLRLRLLSVALLVATSIIVAQNPTSKIRVDVALVTVDVMVSDSAGRPVTDLTRDDFLIFEDGKPQELRAFSTVDSPNTILLLIDRGFSMQEHWPLMEPAIARFQPDGSFRISNVFPGQQQLHFDPEKFPGGFYVSGATTGGQDVLKEGLRVGEPMGELDILVRAGAGRVTGTVRDIGGLPVPESRVVLIPSLGNRGPFTEIRTVVTDLAGKFTLSNVQPGDYRIVSDVSRDVRLGIRYWEAPGWLSRFEGRGRQLRVEVNGESRVDLEVDSERVSR